MIKEEIVELVKNLRVLEPGCSEWEKIIDILEKKYEMTSWCILGLFDDPPTLEYTKENKHLLLKVDEWWR